MGSQPRRSTPVGTRPQRTTFQQTTPGSSFFRQAADVENTKYIDENEIEPIRMEDPTYERRCVLA